MVLLKSVLAGLGAVAIAMLAMALYVQATKYQMARYMPAAVFVW